MFGISWTIILIAALIGVVIGGAVVGFVCYRIGYNKMRDEAHEYEKLHLLGFNL